MKFVQIHTFYDKYLHDFYQQRKHLFGRPFAELMTELRDDAFSASHMFGFHLGQLGFDSHVFIANDPVTQVTWCNENGYPVVDSNTWIQDLARIQIDKLKPEILYLSNPIDFDSKFVRSLSYKPKFVFGWRAASYGADTDLSSFDLLLSSDDGCLKTAIEKGAKSVKHFLPGVPEWISKKVEHEPKLYDVSFCGQITSEHLTRVEIVKHLARVASTTQKFTPKFFINEVIEVLAEPAVRNYTAAPVWAMDMHRAIKNGKIGLNCFIDFAVNQVGNMRQFEVLGTGTFLLTQHDEKLKEQFEIGSEIETYKSLDELVEKIIYFSSHDKEREEIAKRGQARCFKDHGLENRLKEFAQFIHNHLNQSDANRSFVFREQDAQSCINNAINELAAGKVTQALTMLDGIKSFNVPTRDLNYVRGLCLIEMKMFPEAKEALRAEIRFFPENIPASELLRELELA